MHGVDLRASFIEQAEALAATVHPVAGDEAATDAILELLEADKSVLAWDFAHIPVQTLAAALAANGVQVADPQDGTVRVGITGVDAALAATGSLIVSAREGRPRHVSLLPHVHIAVVRESQILPHVDAWLAQQAQDTAGFRAVGNHVIITGASRTADIGMELVLGAHGPAQLHIILLLG